jgi:hypothetical protein
MINNFIFELLDLTVEQASSIHDSCSLLSFGRATMMF